MLNMYEIHKLHRLQEELFESDEKELLGKLLFEYTQYIQCGTVEECQSRKEWMSMSIDDIRVNFNSVVKGLQEEVKNIRDEQDITKKTYYGKRNKGDY